MIIDKQNKECLREYLNICSKYHDIDVDYFYDVTISYINNHDKKKYDETKYQHIQNMFDKWYISLPYNPDYSVYYDPYYFCEVWLCWIRYSRRTLKEIQSKKSLFGRSIVEDTEDVNKIIDLGCGFGYTTASLKEIYSKAEVIGTNLEGSLQYKIAKEISLGTNIEIKGDYKNTKCDLIFASEYFEHFERPVEHLIDVIKETQPKYLIVANSFGPKAIGHFNTYMHLNLTLNATKTSKLFNETLKNLGYNKMDTKCWNNRPTYYKKH